MRRFLLSDRLADKMVVAGGEAHHMLRVLRLAAGDQVVVVDPVGQAAVARITQASDTEVFLSMETMLAEEREAPITIRLAQGLPKSDKMDFIVRERPGNDYLLIIGPEGGLSSREVQLAQERGAAIVTMGPRILRTETAALAAIAAVMYEHGDLGG